AQVASRSAAVSFLRSTARARLVWIRARPLSRNDWLTSITTTLYPFLAITSAMPEPISPQPTTPTVLICMIHSSEMRDCRLGFAGVAKTIQRYSTTPEMAYLLHDHHSDPRCQAHECMQSIT